ncbi:MAG: AAA family ATPase, partial [Thermomicrobiales bacterium]|nr:AAA family ATPase [Thermomicrobiales bacterium]
MTPRLQATTTMCRGVGPPEIPSRHDDSAFRIKKADCFAHRCMLPVAPTPLVGRERELALALALLRRSEVRLLTLTGPGGIGKTRLALAVAAAAAEASFAAGVCFVPLAAVPDADLVAPAVARAAGLVDAGDIPAQDRLVAALRQSATLLVLDNFEHVAAAAPLVGHLLAACPGLKVLATSRTLLRVDGEHTLPV